MIGLTIRRPSVRCLLSCIPCLLVLGVVRDNGVVSRGVRLLLFRNIISSLRCAHPFPGNLLMGGANSRKVRFSLADVLPHHPCPSTGERPAT